MNMFERIKNKIFLLIGRGVLSAIDNSDSQIQKIQNIMLDGDTISEVERYQPYGFETYPVIANADTVNLFVNGNRSAKTAINILVNNRKLRPNDLASGDVCMYSKDSNNSNQNRVTIKPVGNTIELKTADGNLITIDSNGVKITDKNSNEIEMKSTGIYIKDASNNSVNIDTGLIDIKNTVSNMKDELQSLWDAIISLNTNLQSFVSTNCVVGNPVTPDPATLALFIADNVTANLNKTAVASFLK